MTNFPNLGKHGKKQFGAKNKWKGKSGYKHQIDVSIENGTDILLIECKCWNRTIPPEVFLTMWARVLDIEPIAKDEGRKVRGAVVTLKPKDPEKKAFGPGVSFSKRIQKTNEFVHRNVC